jgi:hypothetical protein
MKLLGRSDGRLWYGRKKGHGAPVQLMVYTDGGGLPAGRPDFQHQVPLPRPGPRPKEMPIKEWNQRRANSHWSNARKVVGEIDGVSAVSLKELFPSTNGEVVGQINDDPN